MVNEQPEPMTDSEFRRLMVKIVVTILLIVGGLIFCKRGIEEGGSGGGGGSSTGTCYLVNCACWVLSAIILWPRMWWIGMIAGSVAGAGVTLVATNVHLPLVLLNALVALAGAVPGIALYVGLLRLAATSGWVDPFPDKGVGSGPGAAQPPQEGEA